MAGDDVKNEELWKEDYVLCAAECINNKRYDCPNG